jgi:class 3 adenylate cyclase/tetratricopeptide (TPR) repeat protein
MIQHPDEISRSGDSHRLAAIVFADIVGSTATMEQDEKLALKNLARMREIACPQVEAHAGKIIKELGDGFLAVFNSAIKATTCSLAIQKDLQGEEDPKLRISIHIGDVVVDRGDVFGSGVNIASRLNSHAPPGGIAVSGDVWRQLQNKGEYAVRSLGLKEMKGVGEPFEVFELLESAQAPGKRTPLLQGLKVGHIPHYLGPYLVGGWTFMHFTNWFVGQYLLSPYLPKFVFTLLVSLIPTAILLGYLQKQRGPKAKRYRMVGIPVNLILSGALLLGLFRNKDLGSMMINVSAMSEEGQTVQRTIPKVEFRKKIMLFYFDNETGDSTFNWLYYGIMEALYYDLYQDLFIDVTYAHVSGDKIKRAGYERFSKLPLSFKLKTTQDEHKDILVCGSFTKPDTNYVVNTEMYAVENGKLLSSKTFKGRDLFKLIDHITVQIKTDLKEPPQWLDKAKDLPVKDITTDSLSAWRMLINSMFVGGETRISCLKKAVEIDPGFALAYKRLFEYYSYYSIWGLKVEAPKVAQKAMENIYRLPDKEQLNLKVDYFNFQEHDVDKIIALLQPWCELHPEDIDMRKQLAENYRYKGNNERAHKEYKNILKTAPGEYDIYLELGELATVIKNPKEADGYYEEYVKHYPNDLDGHLRIGEVYYWEGDTAKARKYLERANMIKPDDPRARSLLASLRFYSGDFQKGQELLHEAFRYCKTRNDSFGWYTAQMAFYGFRGQMKKGMETNLQMLKLYDYDPKFAAWINMVYGFFNYYSSEGKKLQYHLIDSLQNDLIPSHKILAQVEFTEYYLESNDITNAEKEVAKAESLLQISITTMWQKEYWPESIRRLKLAINGLKGNLNEKEAMDYYGSMWGTESGVNTWGQRSWRPDPLLGKLYNRLGNLSKPEKILKDYLKRVPYQPDAHYELALVYSDMGKKDKAVEHLNKALYVWAEADTDYIPAKKAREKLAELQATK